MAFPRCYRKNLGLSIFAVLLIVSLLSSEVCDWRALRKAHLLDHGLDADSVNAISLRSAKTVVILILRIIYQKEYLPQCRKGCNAPFGLGIIATVAAILARRHGELKTIQQLQ
jgi:hypothetical protein